MKSEHELYRIANGFFYNHDESQYPRALEAYQELLKHYPEHHEGWEMMSNVQHDLHDCDGALASINEALRLKPEKKEYIRSKERFLSIYSQYQFTEKGLYDMEEKEYYPSHTFNSREELLLEYRSVLIKFINIVNPHNDPFVYDIDISIFYGSLAKVALELENFSEAEKYLMINKQRGEFEPLFEEYILEEVYQSLSKLYEMRGEIPKAIKYMDLSVSLSKPYSFIWKHKAEFLLRQGKSEEANDIYEKILSTLQGQFIATGDAYLIAQKSTILMELGRYEEALEAMNEIEHLLSDDNKLYIRTENKRKDICEKGGLEYTPLEVFEVEVPEVKEIVETIHEVNAQRYSLKVSIDSAEFEQIITDHQIFLETYSGTGKWNSFNVSEDTHMATLQGECTYNQANVSHRDISDFDFTGVNLRCSNLVGTFGACISFESADLRESIATDSFFEGTWFRDAQLAGSDFSRAVLRECSFINADLRDINFEGADLRDADFTGANTEGAVFTSCKMDGCIGLNHIDKSHSEKWESSVKMYAMSELELVNNFL